MKIWKRNAVLASVLLLVCAGIYLNWAYRAKPQDLTETLNAEQVLDDTTLVMNQSEQELSASDEQTGSSEEYFAQVRLSRQESRDSAVELLEQTIAYDEGTELASTAGSTLNSLVSTALSEAQIESLIVAKGYQDCVTYIHDDLVSVAVSAPQDGLTDTDVALISDVVTGQTDYDLSQIRIVEVKS